MDAILLLKSKLMTPELPDKALYSKRIRDLHIIRERIVVFTAPAGFGKTTAVLLSLKKEREKTRWYRLEKEDSFLPVFYSHLIETLFVGKEKLSLDCFHTLSSIQNISQEYPLLNALICQDASLLFEEVNEKLYLVLDDFHNILNNPVIAETVQYFISNMPMGISIIVTSRVETGILSGKLALSKNVLAFDENALRFTKEETEKLVSGTYKLRFTPKEVERIYEYSEGWIAGLYMICHTDKPAVFDSTGSVKYTKGENQDKFKQFFNEFLLGVEPDRLIAISKISILPDFSSHDLRGIFKMEAADEMIAWLEKSNLYIQKVMTKPIKYQFHSLFRKELETYLYQHMSDAQIRDMHFSAANYYLQLGDLRLAIRFYIASDYIDKAIKIVSDAGSEAFAEGKPEKVMYFINEFSEEVIKGDPYLLFFRGVALINVDLENSYNCFRIALLMFKEQKNMSFLMNTFGMIIVIAFQTNDFKYTKSIVNYIPKLRIMLSSAKPRKKLIISAFVNIVANDYLKLGNIIYKPIERMGKSESIWDYSFWMMKGMMLYRTGRLKAAHENLTKVLNHPVGITSDQWRIIGLVSCHNIFWLMRDIEASQKIAEEFAALGEKYNSIFSRSFAYRLTAIIKFQTRDIAGAVVSMEETVNAYVKYGSPVLASAANITKCLWVATNESAKELSQIALDELANVPPQNAGHGYFELCQAMTGALCKRAGDYVRAEELLLQSFHAAKQKNALQHMCGTAMHLADLYFRCKNQKLEEKYLNIWVRQTAKGEFVFFHEMDYVTLVRVCARAMEKQLHIEHMHKVISIYFGIENAMLMASEPSSVALDPEAFISSSIVPEQKTKTIYAKLFGSFTIRGEEIEIKDTEWKTRKISGILKYILANPTKAVSRETLAAVFWPESDTKAASTSLRVALCELRKTLARYDMAFESDYALIVEDKNGFHIGDRTIVKTDVYEFTCLYNKYKSTILPPEEIEPLLMQINLLYENDFLEGNEYDEWVSLSREHYKSMFIQASHTLAMLYIKEEAFKQAEVLLTKHLKIDPYDEKASGMLIHIFEITEQTSRASSLRRQFNKRFKETMGQKPDLSF